MTKDNIAWIDLLRIVACFLVILAHCCDPFVAKFDDNTYEFLSAAFWGSFVRPCVPLFVMISGVLLLPVKTDSLTFYRKRLSRILIPFAIWSIVAPILFYLYLNSGITTLNQGIDMNAHTWQATVTKFWTFLFNFNYDTIPLWYIYMLVGIYLFMPIMSAWLNQATKKEIKVFLGIWLFTTLLPYIKMIAPLVGYEGNYGSMGILGECLWNPFGSFYYFSGFIGYIVLAYYLVKYPLSWSLKKTVAIATPIWIVGYAITSLGFVLTQKYSPGSYEQLEIIWYFFGLNVTMMTFSTFIIMQKLPIKPSKALQGLAKLTFGIFLSHFIVVQICYDWIYPNVNIAPYLQILLIAVCAFALTAVAIWALSKLPKGKYIVG